MKEHIDKIVKDALEDLEVPYNPASWDAMQERMDATSSEEFDQTIKSQVTGISATYRHKHWLQLKQWLDYRWYASNKVYVSKTAEAVLMLLALFTFFNYNTGLVEKIQNPGPVAHQMEQPVGQPSDIVSSISTSISDQNQNIQSGGVQLDNQDKLKKSGNINNLVAQVDNMDTQPTLEITNGDAVSKHSSESASKIAAEGSDGRVDDLPVVKKNIFVSDEGLVATSLKDEGAEIQKELNDKILAEHSIVELQKGSRLIDDENGFINSSVVSSTGALPMLAMNLLSSDNTDDVIAANDLQLKLPAEKKWAISSFVDLDFNQITTPYDHLYSRNGYNQNKVGMGGGLLVHRDLGPVEISTGVSYSSKKYNPKEFIEFVKNTPSSDGHLFRFERIQLNLLTIPIHVAHYITKKGNWRPYIIGGGAAHLALQAEYDKRSLRVPRSVPAEQVLENNQGATFTVGQPKHERKDFPDGLLENGAFKDNHYFTIDLGIGIERKLTASTSLFVQPTVYYNFFNKGLSANDDKINTFSLQLGTKIKI